MHKIKKTKLYSILKTCQRAINLKADRNKIYREYAADRDRFIRYASPLRDFRRPENRLAFIVMLYHSLEKGMSLSSPRFGFGKQKAGLLCKQMKILKENHSGDSRYGQALTVYKRWLNWNRNLGVDYDDLAQELDSLAAVSNSSDNHWRVGGVSEVRSADIAFRVRESATSFMQSRHSIRQFSAEPVDVSTIEEAVRLAQTSPSLCNRQSSHVYVFSKGPKMNTILRLQGGSHGFSEQVDKVLIVTSELACFLSTGERNQCWVEGGMFALALIYGLHAKGLGSCCLNWAKEEEEDSELHAISGIPKDQRIVVLIAVGNLPDKVLITHSPRRILGEIMHMDPL